MSVETRTILDSRQRVEKKSQSQVAATIFAQASMQCPASVTAQAAYIARECKGLGISDPMHLYDAIQADDVQLQKLSKTANAAHGVKKRSDIPEIDELDVLSIMNTDFKYARDYMILDNGQLTAICTTLYQTNIMPGLSPSEGEERETRMHNTVQHWIEPHQAKRRNVLTSIFDSATISNIWTQSKLWVKQ